MTRLFNWCWLIFAGIVGLFGFLVIWVVLGVLGGLLDGFEAWGDTMEDLSKGKV